MGNIKGIHHVSMKTCSEEEYNKAVEFYRDILELECVRTWEKGIMLDTGAGIIEIFNDGETQLEKGTIRHFAFDVNDTDKIVSRVKEAGYTVFIEPKDIVIASRIPYPARIAFCYGPLGEEIEFFQVK